MKTTTKAAGLAAAAIVAVGGALLSFSPETDMARTLGGVESRWAGVYAPWVDDGEGNRVTIAELATKDHAALTSDSRAAADAHPIDAITGLSAALQPATQASPGLLSPDDKIKVDNIETIVSSAVVAEAAVRASADESLEQRITAETQAREHADSVSVQYDGDGGITMPAGTGVKIEIPGETEAIGEVLMTDAAGNVTLGAPGRQINLVGVPTSPLAAPGTSTLQIANTQFVEAATSDAIEIAKVYADEGLAYKADLVGGKVPPEQLPDTEHLWRVGGSAELTTLTDARANDNAYIVGSNPAKLYKLIAEPPTTAVNWMDISNTGSVVSVAGKTGAVTLYAGDISGLQAVLDDTAKMADLAGKASTHNQTFTGIIEVPTATANDDGLRAANTAWVNDRLALAVALATASTATTAGAAGNVIYAPDNAPATVRNRAVTPAGLAAAIAAIPPPVSVESTWLYPNGGTAESPATITTNQRLVMPSPWPGYKVNCTAQLYYNNEWGDVKTFIYAGSNNTQGAIASQFGDSIIVQTGMIALANTGVMSGSPWGAVIGSAPCRVYVEKGGLLP